MTKRVAFHTLGCKLNFSETSTLSRKLEADGYVKTDFNAGADVFVINTCSVTENADKECRQIVRRIRRKNPDAKIAITGCYAQLKPEEIAGIPGVNLVLGASEKFNLAARLNEVYAAEGAVSEKAAVYSCDTAEGLTFDASYSLSDRTRAFLKVQDGCDYNCSFCTIPLARGQSRSDTIKGVLGNMRELAAAGILEIVLTGINLGDFGKGNAGGRNHTESFEDLIRAMDDVDGIERIRISSIEPNLLTNEIVEFVAGSKKFMPHFHIPLQSGSNKILQLMRRRYKRELYAERVAFIKQLMPHCSIGVDVIVGFPGETDADFRETAAFLAELDVSYLHVFTYSERNNTLAAEMKPIVPPAVRQERNAVLRALSDRKAALFIEPFRGTTRKVLLESLNKEGRVEGYTDNYIKVGTEYDAALVNKVVDLVIR